jgi:hypothetical protein
MPWPALNRIPNKHKSIKGLNCLLKTKALFIPHFMRTNKKKDLHH